MERLPELVENCGITGMENVVVDDGGAVTEAGTNIAGHSVPKIARVSDPSFDEGDTDGTGMIPMKSSSSPPIGFVIADSNVFPSLDSFSTPPAAATRARRPKPKVPVIRDPI